MNKVSKQFVAGIGIVLALAIGCGGISEYTVASTPLAVGADLKIVIEKTDTGNYMVTLDAQNVTPPSRLGEGLTVFVVWFVPANQPPQRTGQLNYDEDARDGSMAATTTFRSFDVIVTAELSADVTTPGANIVFQQSVQAPE